MAAPVYNGEKALRKLKDLQEFLSTGMLYQTDSGHYWRLKVGEWLIKPSSIVDFKKFGKSRYRPCFMVWNMYKDGKGYPCETCNDVLEYLSSVKQGVDDCAEDTSWEVYNE